MTQFDDPKLINELVGLIRTQQKINRALIFDVEKLKRRLAITQILAIVFATIFTITILERNAL